MNKVGTSYLLWLTCLFGFAGIHRFYNGKPISGVLWFITWGFFGFGQFVDLFLIPEMVDEHNYKTRARLGMVPGGTPLDQRIQLVIPSEAIATAAIPPAPPAPPTKQQTTLRLLRAAEARGGKLSMTQAVLDTELSFEEVETLLQGMMQAGYVSVENHPETGVVLYHFLEL